jgi:hypothetical protein
MNAWFISSVVLVVALKLGEQQTIMSIQPQAGINLD